MDRHAGVSWTMRQTTQIAFLVRLVALLLGLVAAMGRQLTVSVLLGIVVIGGSSLVGLTNTHFLDLVRRHPFIALLDGLVIAVVVVSDGAGSPLVLAALTTALLIGLWLEIGPGVIVVTALVVLYVLGAARTDSGEASTFLMIVTIPFVYVTLWLLGVTVRRSTDAQLRSHEMLSDAVASAAAAQERTQVARELHDSLAKTLQGMSLMTSALPQLVRTSPERAESAALELRDMSATAVSTVRGVMNGLRVPTSRLSLHESLTELILAWRQGAGHEVVLDIEPVDTGDESVRYELLMIARECLDNVRAHAGPCTVTVRLAASNDDLVLTIGDDGKGAPAEAVAAARRAGHVGVLGMRERIARVGGILHWSTTPGHGTHLECRVQREGLVER